MNGRWKNLHFFFFFFFSMYDQNPCSGVYLVNACLTLPFAAAAASPTVVGPFLPLPLCRFVLGALVQSGPGSQGFLASKERSSWARWVRPTLQNQRWSVRRVPQTFNQLSSHRPLPVLSFCHVPDTRAESF